MKIAFLHYHTKKGGVTTVIGQQISVLRNNHHCIMIKGEKDGVSFGIPTYIIPGLGYDKNMHGDSDPEETAKQILRIVGGEYDVLHIHNPLLKKNRNLIRIIRFLKEHGVRLFLHVHDFAEDGRPSVYFKEDAYPADVHYGVINRRDYRLMEEAGLRKDGLHYLPNMVTPLPYGEWEGEPDLILYPVRGIRRKNLGEMLFLSMFLPPRLRLGITLPPNSEKDMTLFNVWKDTASRYGLPVFFNLGVVEDFTKILGRTLFVLTTSIKEGFGFSFLEPWTIGKEVRGRYLNAVCPDFEEKGIRFPRLYKSLLIPTKIFDLATFEQRWMLGVDVWAGQFEISLGDTQLHDSFSKRFKNGSADFAQLDETAQIEIIDAVHKNPGLKDEIIAENGWLGDFFTARPMKPDDELLEKNRKIIYEDYGPARYEKNLLRIYKQIQNNVPHGLEKKKVLDAFIHIDNYLPLGS